MSLPQLPSFSSSFLSLSIPQAFALLPPHSSPFFCLYFYTCFHLSFAHSLVRLGKHSICWSDLQPHNILESWYCRFCPNTKNSLFSKKWQGFCCWVFFFISMGFHWLNWGICTRSYLTSPAIEESLVQCMEPSPVNKVLLAYEQKSGSKNESSNKKDGILGEGERMGYPHLRDRWREGNVLCWGRGLVYAYTGKEKQ